MTLHCPPKSTMLDSKLQNDKEWQTCKASCKKICYLYNKPPAINFQYGTAGFRYDAQQLPSTVLRCGMVACLVGMKYNGTTGVMLTASHNKESDNGVKMIAPDGSMI